MLPTPGSGVSNMDSEQLELPFAWPRKLVFLDGPLNDTDCPADTKYEHRTGYPHLGLCVPKNLSDRTGRSPGHKRHLNPETGYREWDGGCNWDRDRDGNK